MLKSQELDPILGLGNGWYYATTSTLWWSVPSHVIYCTDLYARCAEGLAAAASYKTPPTFLGNQTFESSTNHRPLWNNLVNRKVHAVSLPVTYAIKASGVGPFGYYAKFYRYGSSGYGTPSEAVPGDPRDYSRDVDGPARRAWWSMQPRFEGEFQALNFLYELKDFKDIAKHIGRLNVQSIVNSAKAAKRKMQYAAARLSQGSTSKNLMRTADAATKTVAEVYLTKQFAIDPTARDLCTLSAQLATLVEKVQKEFYDRGKDLQTSYYSEVLDESQAIVTNTKPSYYWFSSGWKRKAIFTACMQYRYDYRMRSWFDALKRYYGLNVNAGVVWNALPWTFVVDYFLKVGQAIDFMRTDPNVGLRLSQYSESILTEASSGRHHQPHSGALVLINGGTNPMTGKGQWAANGQIIDGYYGSWYTRRITNPNKGVALPRLTLPSSKQRTNLVALLRAIW